MGLLDDAIREHLDLKRRRGADAAEVQRAEHEALGPVRRGPEQAAGAGVEDAELDHASDQEAELDHGHGTEPEWDLDSEQAAVPPTHPSAVDEPPGLESQSAPEPSPATRPAQAPESDEPEPQPFDHGHETAEYDVEAGLRDEPRKGDDDVLEETPEFLQDTPDHDRLWFEQRPPRDFDFDG